MILNQHPKYYAKNQVKTVAVIITCLIVFSTLSMANQTVDRFGFFETSFEATGHYENPYTDLKASAIIQLPDGTNTHQPGHCWQVAVHGAIFR
jgi:hypothetical protein